ncbi:MAG: tRNA (adenosine(37)-N6)-dimethylallyltransferase MiaA [Bacteroidales bacterium]|nr:tRNA (adenosine(37)-N6)-dimethylallyltransferase MiaA [Bacteroidales bacterium]
MPPAYNMIAVIGPTASGKTTFAANLANRIGGEVISADSRQVYRHMDLGTGKDYGDYAVNGVQVPVHLLDIVNPGYRYSVFEYQRDFFRVFSDMLDRGKIPVLCGGSGMYIDAVTRGYRLIEVPRNEIMRKKLRDKSLPELHILLSSIKKPHNITDVDTIERAIRAIEIESYYLEHSPDPDLPPVYPLFIGIIHERTTERSRITERLLQRLNLGMVDEVKQLMGTGISTESLLYYGLEYRYITWYLTGKLDYQTMCKQLNTAIHQFAKRQRTWFRKMEREGVPIHWIKGEMQLEKKLEIVLTLYSGCQEAGVIT